MRPATELVIVIACVVVIVVGGLVISSKVSASCYDFWPFSGKACVVTSK